MVFITNQHGATYLWDDKGHICTFISGKTNIANVNGNLIALNQDDACYFETEDPELIERIKAHGSFGKSIQVYDGKPVYNTLNIISQKGVPSTGANELAVKKLVEEQLQAEREKTQNLMKEYGILYGKLCKAGGAYVANADPAEIARLEEIQKQMGIKNEETN